MNRGRGDVERLKDLAHRQMFSVLGKLGVTQRPGRGSRGCISICNPMRRDKRASFTIMTGGGILTWRDEADAGPGGTRGDIIDLVAYLKGWWGEPNRGFLPAKRWLEDALGVRSMTAAERHAQEARARRKVEEARFDQARDEAEARRAAFALWRDALPILGTRADTYLRQARGIDIELLPKGPRGGDRTPSVLRYIEAHRHGESGRTLPCMIAGMVAIAGDGGGRIRAVHRTWLKADGSDKADVAPQRKMWPGYAGLVIPIWRGADDWLSVKDAIANGVRETLALTEGIEDALSMAMARPSLRIWAAGSLGNIGNVTLPECCDGVLVHRHNDWHTRTALEQFERVMDRLRSQGRPVVAVTSKAGKDFNDALRGAIKTAEGT